MTETKKQEMRERFNKSEFTYLDAYQDKFVTSSALIIDFIEQENIRYAKEAVAEREREIVEMILNKFYVNCNDDGIYESDPSCNQLIDEIINHIQNPHSTGNSEE
jgi:hypothetical protein